MKRNLSKISITLPAETVADLDYVAKRLGISRSAVISNMLSEAAPTLRKVMERIPLDPTNLTPDQLRTRGESKQVILDRLDALEGMTHDLLSGL